LTGPFQKEVVVQLMSTLDSDEINAFPHEHPSRNSKSDSELSLLLDIYTLFNLSYIGGRFFIVLN
jgi:hypothetical protein